MSGNVLLIGPEMNSSIQTYLAGQGISSTIISGNDLATTDLSGYTAIWIGWYGSVTDPNGDLSATLAAFVAGGGNILAEPYTNITQYLPSGLDFTSETVSHGNDVVIVNSAGDLLDGLTSADLSNWFSSYHEVYGLNDYNEYVLVAENSGGSDVTLTQTYGLGHIVITGQDPSWHIKNGDWHGADGDHSPELAFVVNALSLAPAYPSMFVNFDGPTNAAHFNSSYSEDGLTFTSPTHLHFENDMDADGKSELGGHNGGTETIEITKTGGGTFSLIGMDTAAGPFGQNGQVEWIAYRLVGGVYVETGRMVITPGGHITLTSAFLDIDKVIWNSAYTGNGGMAVDNIEYKAASSNVAPGAPTDSDATGDGVGIAATIGEDHAVGTAIGITASATDGDGDTLSYSFGFDINGDPILTSGAFTIDAVTGVVTLNTLLDYEAATSHSLRIYASDGTASSYSDFIVNVTNALPSTPSDSDAASNAVAEGAAPGTSTGVTAASIENNGGPLEYLLTDDAGGRFVIDPVTGAISTGLTGIDYETALSDGIGHYYDVSAIAREGTGDSAATIFRIYVTNVAPGAPSDGDVAGNILAENAANNTYTGVTAAATDVNGGTVTYIMTGNAGGRFKVDASTGQIFATGTGNLDYETAPFSDINGRYYEVAVQSSDGTDQSAATTFKIYVTNVVEHLFTPGNDGSAAAPINFNTLPDGAYDPDGAQYNALAGNDYVYLPNTGAVDAGNPWDYNRTFDAGDGNDVVQGGNGNDSVSGGAGNDALFGGLGDDRLVGASGDDILGGGDGADKLTGSSGKDIFVFTDSEIGTSKLGEHDVITDFQQGTDKIDLSALYDNGVVFGGLVSGKLSNTVGSAYKVGYYTEGGKTWIQGDVNGDGTADFSIELSGSYKLKGTDLVVGSSAIISEAQWSAATGGLAYSPYHHDDYFL